MSLFDYYGGRLPSLAERAQTYKANGGQGNYMGTAQQNNFLEGKLRGGGSAPGTTVTSGGGGPSTMVDWTNENWGNVESAQNRLATARSGLEDPVARYKRLAQETGVSAQQESIANLLKSLNTQQGLLTNLEPGINDRLKGLGTQVTEAQRNRWLAHESEPITKSIGDISRAKGVEEAGLATKMDTLNNMLSAAFQGDERALQSLADAVTMAQGKFSAGREAFGSDLDYKRSLAKEKASGSSAASKKEETLKKGFNDDLSKGLGSKIAIHGEEDQEGYISRETLIKRLQQRYPEIDDQDIETAVYNYYAG